MCKDVEGMIIRANLLIVKMSFAQKYLRRKCKITNMFQFSSGI